MRELIFLDTETTGLNPRRDQIVEVSWATLDGPIKTMFFSGIRSIPAEVDELIGFTRRGVADEPRASYEDIQNFLDECEGNTMVSANPYFDRSFLEENGLYSFHYRTLDIESFGMKALGLDFVPGMSDLYKIISEEWLIPEPDHTSAGDVASLRAIYKYLEEL